VYVSMHVYVFVRMYGWMDTKSNGTQRVPYNLLTSH